MATEPTVSFWTKNDYEGTEYSFTGAQRTDNAPKGTDSIKTGANSWMIAFDDRNFTGNELRMGGADAANHHDLNHLDRDGKDWKHQIDAFVLYDYEPPFWDGGTFDPNLPASAEVAAMLFRITDFCGNNRNFPNGSQISDLSEESFTTNSFYSCMDIESLRAGDGTWMTIYSDINFGGDSLNVTPGTYYKDLNDVNRASGGDWKHQVRSLQTFASSPNGWNMGFNYTAFGQLFDGASTVSDDVISYTTQDATYLIHRPWQSYPNVDGIQISTCVEYEANGKNDKLNLNVQFDRQGKVTSLTFEYYQGNARQIPPKLVTAVDDSAEILGAVGALETAGISEEAAEAFVEGFDTAVKLFDAFANLAYKLGESDDGRYYLAAVGAQVAARISLCIVTNVNQ